MFIRMVRAGSCTLPSGYPAGIRAMNGCTREVSPVRSLRQSDLGTGALCNDPQTMMPACREQEKAHRREWRLPRLVFPASGTLRFPIILGRILRI